MERHDLDTHKLDVTVLMLCLITGGVIVANRFYKTGLKRGLEFGVKLLQEYDQLQKDKPHLEDKDNVSE